MTNNSNIESTVEVEYPNFTKIVNECKGKIKKKFPEYGNSWNNVYIDDRFWKKRLEGELKEIWNAENSYSKRQEIIDAMNILAMMYHLTDIKCKEEHEIYKRTWRYG